MTLKDTWNDLIDGESAIIVGDINRIANAVIELEERPEADSTAPYIGENGNWFEWDKATDTFVDTGVKAQGEDGYTPVRGTEYWTDEDKEEIVQELDTEGYVKNLNLQNGEGIDSVVQTVCDPENENKPAPIATGTGAVALGRFNEAHGKCSMAVNYDNVVNGTYSFACGNGNFADGNCAFVSGNVSKAQGAGTVAMGLACVAEGDKSFAAGQNGASKGVGSCTIGCGNVASGDTSVALGNYNAVSGMYATSVGSRNVAEHRGSFIAGEYNQTPANWAAVFGVNNDYSDASNVFMVGCGRNSTYRNNVFEVSNKGIVRIKKTYATPSGAEVTLMLGDTAITEAQLQKLLALITE